MQKAYNQIAGRSIERLNALSDGLFAIAMTLIVLEIRVPPHAAIHTESELWAAVVALAPQTVTYLLSFLTLGIFWVGQQSQLHYFKEGDRNLSWIHLAFLAAVATLPFTTHLLADFITFRVALLVYWLNIVVLGGLLYVSFAYADRAGLIDEGAPAGYAGAVRRRIVTAQGLYALAATLCVFSTYWSIGMIFLLQLYYAVAPRLPRRLRAAR
jgi:uncharacterized membrane protein